MNENYVIFQVIGLATLGRFIPYIDVISRNRYFAGTQLGIQYFPAII